jgi:hypothetical protein
VAWNATDPTPTIDKDMNEMENFFSPFKYLYMYQKPYKPKNINGIDEIVFANSAM